MSDVREGILARLLEVVSAIPNMRSAHRNNVDIPEDQMPAVIVLDGDEEAATDSSTRPSTKPQVVTMTPGIVVQVQNDNVVLGSTITTFRQELLKLVLTDNQLIQLTGTNGSIRYLGCETDVGWTRTGFAALTARFAFKYPLKPWEL
jgi:hypothetical protein